MFDFGNANDSQKQAIVTTDGPVLITAGPGTGKTFTLVQRAIYLIQEKGVRPEEILLATFTDKAAKELITRIRCISVHSTPCVCVSSRSILSLHVLRKIFEL